MKSLSRFSLVCCGILLAVSAPLLGAPANGKQVMPTGDAKKLAARYALTKTRIDSLLGARLNPTPLPAGVIPNPFYKADPAALFNPIADKGEKPVVPDAPDLSDADALAKYASALKVGGSMTVGGAPHVTVNQVTYKLGDVITVGTKDHPVFLRIDSITSQEFVLKLNEATYTVPIRK